jgi:hypothetical protein
MEFEIDESKRLYKDGDIEVYSADTIDEHNLIVGNSYCYLSRGILKECSETDSAGLEQRLDAIHPFFLLQLHNQRVSLERVGWAISKARIKELEKEVAYFIDQYHEAKSASE